MNSKKIIIIILLFLIGYIIYKLNQKIEGFADCTYDYSQGGCNNLSQQELYNKCRPLRTRSTFPSSSSTMLLLVLQVVLPGEPLGLSFLPLRRS